MSDGLYMKNIKNIKLGYQTIYSNEGSKNWVESTSKEGMVGWYI